MHFSILYPNSSSAHDLVERLHVFVIDSAHPQPTDSYARSLKFFFSTKLLERICSFHVAGVHFRAILILHVRMCSGQTLDDFPCRSRFRACNQWLKSEHVQVRLPCNSSRTKAESDIYCSLLRKPASAIILLTDPPKSLIDVGVITYKVDLPSTGLSTMSLQPEDFNPSCKGNHVSQQPLDT